jgi:UDP-2-acetamido-2-deoxy-ribo-hexuluronate aminotransferase
MRQIRVHGQSKKHHHPVLGLNGRLDTIQAAILIPKLAIFNDEITKRQHVAGSYSKAIANSPFVEDGLQLPTVAEGHTSVWAQYTVLSPDRDTLREKLKAAGIPSVSYYAVPLHLQPVFEDLGHKKGDFPIAEKVASEGISLPMNPYLSEEEIQQVVTCFSFNEK